MIWAILALVGVPLWLIVGALGVILWHRRQVKRLDGIFRCKARIESGAVPGLKQGWPRSASYAHWVHDVLVLHVGPTLTRTCALGGLSIDGAVELARPTAVKGLGSEPAVVSLRLDSGALVRVAAPSGDKDLLTGPYAVAQIAPTRNSPAHRKPPAGSS